MTAAAGGPPVWERGGWTPLPPLDQELGADACVVGLGGAGLACVKELLALGARVVGIDARDAGAGAAGRNGGFLLAGLADFHHRAAERLGRDRARALYLATLGELDRQFDSLPGIARRTGSLRIALSPDEEADCAEQLGVMRRDGLPAEAYEGPEGRGLLIPSDGAFDPLERCRELARRAMRRGARLFGASPATRIAAGQVDTPRGAVRCGIVIVAVDGALERAVPALAGRVRTARLQMLATAPTDELRLTRPVYARWGYEYWQQLPDRRIALGGFRDAGGDAEWTADATPSEPVQRELERFLREHLHVRAPVTHRWAAPVAYSSTGLPVLAEASPGVWATGAYSGTGNVIGQLCGRAAARLALGAHDDFARLIGE